MIIHVCDNATVRVFKEVYELQKTHNTTLLYRTCQHRDLLELLGRASLWSAENILEAKLSGIKNKIIHVHTSINSASLIKNVIEFAGKHNLIVFDIHDLVPDNFNYMSGVQAVILPSNGYARQIKHENKLVLYSKVPSDFIQIKNQKKLDAICLISEVLETPEWRNYHYAINQSQMPFFIFPANAAGWENYSNVMQRLPYLKMLDAVQQFKYGYAGCPNPACNFNDIVTNKYWEYIACGLEVVLSNNSSEMKELYSVLNKIGVYMDSEIFKLRSLYEGLQRGFRHCMP